MSARFTKRISRIERLMAAIHQDSACLPDRISARMRARARAIPQIKFRFGDLQRLPEDYRGERHVVITKRLPNQGNQEWVEFQEMPGPDPNPPPEPGFVQYRDIMFVAPHQAEKR
jgi:hypothetical protein